MKGRSALDRARDAAFSLQIRSRGQDQATPIVAMCAIDGKMHIFKEDSIFLVQTPDDIDPERAHPDTRGATTQIYDIGTRHPLVARTVMQAKSLLDSVVFAEEISSDEILSECFHLFRELATCNLIHQRLANLSTKKMDEVPQALADSQGGHFIGDLPQVPHLEEEARAFFLTAHKALKRLSVLTDLFFPMKPRKQNFSQLCDWLLINRGEASKLYKMLQADLEWIVSIWEIRNAIEHPNGIKYDCEVRNIEIAPGGKFYPPRWRFVTPRKRQDDYVGLLPDMEACLENLLSLTENLLVLCVAETWNNKFPFLLYKIAQERLDPRCPVQYGVTIDQERLRNP